MRNPVKTATKNENRLNKSAQIQLTYCWKLVSYLTWYPLYLIINDSLLPSSKLNWDPLQRKYAIFMTEKWFHYHFMNYKNEQSNTRIVIIPNSSACIQNK